MTSLVISELSDMHAFTACHIVNPAQVKSLSLSPPIALTFGLQVRVAGRVPVSAWPVHVRPYHTPASPDREGPAGRCSVHPSSTQGVCRLPGARPLRPFHGGYAQYHQVPMPPARSHLPHAGAANDKYSACSGRILPQPASTRAACTCACRSGS